MVTAMPRMDGFDEERTEMSTLKKGDLVTYVYDNATVSRFKIYRQTGQIGIITADPVHDWQSRVSVKFEEDGDTYRLEPRKLRKLEPGAWVTALLRYQDEPGQTVTGPFQSNFGGDNPTFMYVGAPIRHAQIFGARLTSGPTKTETKEEEKSVTDLFGPKPEPIVTTVIPPGPRYTAPFYAAGSKVQDSTGTTIVSVDLYHEDYQSGDDDRVAHLIATALNAKYGAEAPAQKYPGINGMRVGHRVGEDPAERGRLAYEVAPGRFWWAVSAQDAENENRHKLDTEKGWAIGLYRTNRLIDANTGGHISA